ncbi:MAG: hypothetical protein ACD_80C00170G0003, partial [uncultured bacterium (gcode 4)]
MTKLLLSMPDIHCKSCEKLILASLNGVSWIKSITVSLEKKEVEVSYDEKKTDKIKIAKLISEWTGYSVTEKWKQISEAIPVQTSTPDEHCEMPVEKPIDTNSKMVSIDIEWMHCSSCALLIEKSLKKTPGVLQASVNFSSAQAMVKVDPTDVSEKDLIQAVKNAGYEWSIVDQKHAINETEKRNHETQHRWKKLKRAAILSAPMILFMLYDFLPGVLPGGSLIMPRTAIISLILSIPIQFIIGADFYKWTWSALKMKT